LPSLDGAIDSAWPCLCNDLDLSAQVFADFATAIATAFSSGEFSIRTLQDVTVGMLPTLFGQSALCSTSCREALTAIADWAIAAADAVLGIDSIKQALPWIPSVAAGLTGLPAKGSRCICEGFQWSDFAALFDSTVPEVIEAGVGLVTADDELTVSSGFQAAVARLAKYPAFIFSTDGLCAGQGCQEAMLQGLTFGLDVLSSALQYYGGDAGGNHIPDAIVTAVGDLQADTIVGTLCGRTLDWTAMFLGVAEALSVLAAPSSSADAADLLIEHSSSANVHNETHQRESSTETELIARVCSSVFSPSFLCSSATSKELTAQVMDIVHAVGSAIDEVAFLTDVASNDWCPSTHSAGVRIKQTYVVAGDVSSFDAAAFKTRLVTWLNRRSSSNYFRLTPSMVSLELTGGSVHVHATIAAAPPQLVSDMQSTLEGASSTDLTSNLGVVVESVSSVTADEVDVGIFVNPPLTDGNGSGKLESLDLIAAIAGGVGGIVLLLAVAWACARSLCASKAKATVKEVEGSKPATKGSVATEV